MWKPTDFIIAGLVFIVGFPIVVGSIREVAMGEEFSDSKDKILASVISSILAIIAVYIGHQFKGPPDDE
jgi:hypothetical protein